MIYLRYDHGHGPGPRGDEYIGPFDSEAEADSLRRLCFSHLAPISIEIQGSLPCGVPVYSPEETLEYMRGRQ